mgnify:CR=1 FL=1
MDKSIVNIIKNFGTEGDLLVAGKRNVIKTFPYNTVVLNIKSFKIPIFITQNSKDPRINGNDAVQFVKELKKRNSPVTYLEKEDNKTVLNREEARKKSYAALELFLQDNLRKR